MAEAIYLVRGECPDYLRELESKRQAVIDAAKFFCGEALPNEVTDPFTPLERAVAELNELEKRIGGDRG